MSLRLQQTIERAREHQPLEIENIDYTLHNPERLREELGNTFSYFGRVEKEVQRDAKTIETFLPHLAPELSDFVQNIWVPQEVPHGQAFDALQGYLGDTPLPLDDHVGFDMKLAGQVARMSPSLHRTFEMVYVVRGALHEKMTAVGYRREQAHLERLGERALIETMFKPIRAQEAGHLNVYKAAAEATKAQLAPWQLWLARKITLATYTPVGTGNPSDQNKPHFGQLADVLTGESLEDFVGPVQDLAHDLLVEGDGLLPKFVIKSVAQCIELSRQQAA